MAFPCGRILDKAHRTIRIYFGFADTGLVLSTAQFSEVLNTTTLRAYFLARACRSGSHLPFSLLLATDCWMKYIPSTPSLIFG